MNAWLFWKSTLMPFLNGIARWLALFMWISYICEAHKAEWSLIHNKQKNWLMTTWKGETCKFSLNLNWKTNLWREIVWNNVGELLLNLLDHISLDLFYIWGTTGTVEHLVLGQVTSWVCPGAEDPGSYLQLLSENCFIFYATVNSESWQWHWSWLSIYKVLGASDLQKSLFFGG